MTHSVSEEYLYRENIDKYLEALAERIKIAGIGEHKILVVGGVCKKEIILNLNTELFYQILQISVITKEKK